MNLGTFGIYNVWSGINSTFMGDMSKKSNGRVSIIVYVGSQRFDFGGISHVKIRRNPLQKYLYYYQWKQQ